MSERASEDNSRGEPQGESQGREAIASQVVTQFNEIVKPDGGEVSLIALEPGVLRVRYVPGQNDECESCVMTSDALAAMMQDMVATLEPSIERVEIEH